MRVSHPEIQLGAALCAPVFAVANAVAPGMVQYWFMGVQICFAAYIVANYLETDEQTKQLLEAVNDE